MTDLWAGLGGPTNYQFDANPLSWSSAIGLGSTALWDALAPVEVGSVYVSWHYGGPYLHDGSPGGVSGAAGPFVLEGSADGSTGWTAVVTDPNPVATWGAVWPGDFDGTYVVDPPQTFRYWRWTNTSGANNDWYKLSAFGPEVATPVVPSGPIAEINGVRFTDAQVIFRAELNAAGEGHITMDRNDPQATAENLERGSIVYVYVPEIDPDVPVFAFVLENGDWDVISSDEEGGEELRFGGPGALWLLNRAVIAPEEYETGTGYPKPLKGIWVFADGVTEGHILNKLLREAESVSRPQQPLAGVSDDFTSVLDSDGVSWGDEVLDGKWRVPIGASLYDEVLRLVAAGLIQIEMDPSAGPGEDLVLHAWRTIGTDRTGDFGAGVVRFEKAVNIADEMVKSMAGRDFASHAYIRYGEDGGDYTNTAKTGSWPYVQEIFVEANTSAATTARRIAKGQMGWREAAQDAPAFATPVPWPGDPSDEDAGIYIPGPRWTANGLYWVGDLVTLHTGTGETDYDEQTFRVYAVTIQGDETGYLAPPLVELGNAYSGPNDGNLRSVASMSNTGGLAGGTGSGGGGSGGTGGGIPGGTYQTLAEKGQDDGYAALDGDGLVPIDQLGTGGDGSGDNVLHDDGTWSPGAGGSSMWFNVTDYGAVADSATDCRAAIVAADAAAAAVGGVVYFPASADTYYVLWSSVRHSLKPSAGVTWQGDGMYSSVIELDPGSTISTSSAGQPFIEIGTATAGASNITLRDLGLNVHFSTKGNSTNKFLQGIAAQHDTTGSAHSDDITIERVRVHDVNAGIGCGKGALTPSASNHFERWRVVGCEVELTENKAIELDQADDSVVIGCRTINCMDGLQLLNYSKRCLLIGNRVEYKDAGINLSEGISDCEVADNDCIAIAGGGLNYNGGLVIRRESYTSSGPTSSRVKVHHNIFDDSASDASAHKIGVQFATYTANTGVATFEDYELYANTFIADINYVHDAWFPTKSQAVRLRVYDNHFTDEVITHTDWVSDRTRFERNHVEGDLSILSDNWDLRGNTVDGAFTDSGTGTTYDDGYVRNVLVSATAPTAGDVLTATSATAAEWTAPGAGIAAEDLAGLGVVGPILIADDHSTPLVFADLIQTEDGDDLLYADVG